jgi:tRNA threonylcarbamoyladenosine biosynthesis protein TsaE
MNFISKSETQTKNLAKKLARDFESGRVIGLAGDLGSGKTQFVKGVAEYFKIKQHITSPTFVVVKIYNVPRNVETQHCRVFTKRNRVKKIIHIDCYRLNSEQELLSLGVNEFFNNPNYLTIIEWADKIKNILPKDVFWVKFKNGRKEDERIIEYKDFK